MASPYFRKPPQPGSYSWMKKYLDALQIYFCGLSAAHESLKSRHRPGEKAPGPPRHSAASSEKVIPQQIFCYLVSIEINAWQIP